MMEKISRNIQVLNKSDIKPKSGYCIFIVLFICLSMSSVFAVDRKSDAWKEAQIVNMISSNEVLDGYSIDADVKNGKAVLTGTVALENQKDLAKAIASSMSGITSVENNIVVREGEPRGTMASMTQSVRDATTTAKVKSKILWNRSLTSSDIKINTENNILTLEGKVNSDAEKELAERIALKTSGVSKVENKLTVPDSRARLGKVDFNKVEKNAGEALEDVGKDISDGWITTKVHSSLKFTRSLSIDGLNVTTNKQVVELDGIVDTQAEKELAAEITNDIAGVKKVVNNIKIR